MTDEYSALIYELEQPLEPDLPFGVFGALGAWHLGHKNLICGAELLLKPVPPALRRHRLEIVALDRIRAQRLKEFGAVAVSVSSMYRDDLFHMRLLFQHYSHFLISVGTIMSPSGVICAVSYLPLN